MWLPTERRESNARGALSDRLAQLDDPLLVPAATSAADSHTPAGTSWLPISGSTMRRSGRQRLAELAQLWPQAILPTSAQPGGQLRTTSPRSRTAGTTTAASTNQHLQRWPMKIEARPGSCESAASGVTLAAVWRRARHG
ncbi:hypothetical protein GCM10011609_17290 [Lentzea pudingi]|uniref:Uncharacterized protein n=1 Tax=Lentzea pudingi TaxID=1789439 RepID=A0ABQ2HIB2_9PSEU|nr:hypothetical protein GCM10011609_17290 [Lentzea pudingi]